MSYSAYSYVVFGVLVPRDTIKHTIRIRGCEHTIEPKMNFCPECGKPAYKEKVQNILNPMEDNKLSYFYSDYEGESHIVIGFCVGKTDYNTNTEPVACKVPTPNMILELIEFFKEHNLPYKEKDIKMYVITYHSY
jgi:hypothetical protein